MSNQTDINNCTQVSDICPVEASIYGYYPSLGGNAFFAAFFGICMVVQLFQGIKWKSRTYMIAMVFGCLGESVGMMNWTFPAERAADKNQATWEESCCITTLSALPALTFKSVA